MSSPLVAGQGRRGGRGPAMRPDYFWKLRRDDDVRGCVADRGEGGEQVRQVRSGGRVEIGVGEGGRSWVRRGDPGALAIRGLSEEPLFRAEFPPEERPSAHNTRDIPHFFFSVSPKCSFFLPLFPKRERRGMKSRPPSTRPLGVYPPTPTPVQLSWLIRND